MTEDRFRVEIFNYETGECVAVVGKNLRESKAEKREMIALSRTNKDYGARTVNERTGEVV